MAVDSELRKMLNLTWTSPSFVLREESGGGQAVVQLDQIPHDDHVYWVSGSSVLQSGRSVPSVFVIAEGGGTLVQTYWCVAGEWFRGDDPLALGALSLNRDDVFPFDWSYSVPVTNDIYHQ